MVLIFTLLKQSWDFYPFSTSLLISVLLPFYVKSAELLHYPHPMLACGEQRARASRESAVVTRGHIIAHWTRVCDFTVSPHYNARTKQP